MSEVIELASQNENYKQKCTLASSPFWNVPPEKYEESCKDGNWQFCWVHGTHTWAGKGKYALTTYTSMEALDKKSKEKKLNSFNDAATKDVINVRDHDGHEWNLDCPKELIAYVISMFSLNHSGTLIKYYTSHKKSLDLADAIHLSEMSAIFGETEHARKQIEEKYGRLVSHLFYVINADGSYQLTPDEKEYIINPELTAAQRNKKYRALIKCYKRDLNAVTRKHRVKLNTLRRKEKSENIRSYLN